MHSPQVFRKEGPLSLSVQRRALGRGLPSSSRRLWGTGGKESSSVQKRKTTTFLTTTTTKSYDENERWKQLLFVCFLTRDARAFVATQTRDAQRSLKTKEREIDFFFCFFFRFFFRCFFFFFLSVCWSLVCLLLLPPTCWSKKTLVVWSLIFLRRTKAADQSFSCFT